MGSIFKPTRSENDKRVKYECWYFTYLDERGKRRKKKGFRDKTATEALMNRTQREADRKRAGLRVTDETRRRQQLSELVDLYVAELQRQGRSDVHWKEQKRLLNTLREQCKFTCLADVRPDALQRYLTELQRRGRGPRTLNSYRDALHTFLNWCVLSQGWLEENPLKGFAKAKSGGKKTRPRRAYTIEEFNAVCNASLHHGTLYKIAGLCGLRRAELRKLEKRDLTPIGDRPTWHLRAEITKGKRKEIVPMLAECVELIRPLWQNLKQPTDHLFPRIPRTETLHKDLKRAGVRRVDDEGRYVDFHSFRYFFCTLLARHLPIQTVRLLMRHKDIRQTCNLYMDLGLTDVSEAIVKLPPLLT